jgi:hypothetical protein
MTESSTHDENGRFAKGNPGGPGRPRSIGRSAVALDQIGAGVGEQVLQVIVDKALAGDLRAAELLLSRVWPTRRGRPLEIDAQPLKHLPDLVPAISEVMNAVLTGEVTPREGHDVFSLVQAQCRTLEAVEFEYRLQEIEKLRDDENKKPTGGDSLAALLQVDRTTVFDKND